MSYQEVMKEVLDHGYVRLVDHMGSDLSIVRSARVSYNAAWRTGEDEGKDEKLIRYLLKNRHTTPFESVAFTFDVKAPIFVYRQWHRHRTWCLSGDTKIIFERPCDHKSYPMKLKDVVRKWNPKEPKRSRYERTLKEHNRQTLSLMAMRGPNGTINLTDAWYSGEKMMYKLMTKYGQILSSVDHIFSTPEGPMKLSDNPSYVYGMVPVGFIKNHTDPVFSSHELLNEEWRHIQEGYEISNLGRVRSYFRQGSQFIHDDPKIKKITVNQQGRSVVSIKNRAVQVSHLVAHAFIGMTDESLLIRHLDDNPQNNKVKNLAYGTYAENSMDSYVNGGRTRLRCVPLKVEQILRGGIEDTFDLSVTGEHWFVANNLVVHNSYNEMSARYTELPEEYYLPKVEQIGLQSASSKQARVFKDLGDDVKAIAQREKEVGWVDYACKHSFHIYHKLLEAGWPRELARIVLPLNTYSLMFCTVNLHNLFGYLSLRNHNHAQYEIQVYAQAMLELIEPIVPVAVKAFTEYGKDIPCDLDNLCEDCGRALLCAD